MAIVVAGDPACCHRLALPLRRDCQTSESKLVIPGIPDGFQKIAAELSAKPVPDSPNAPDRESGARSKYVTAASPCALISLIYPNANVNKINVVALTNFFPR